MTISGLVLRDPVDADYPMVARLFPDLATGDAIPSIERWRERIAGDSLVADLDGQALAYIYFEILDGEGYIRHIVVDRGARGRGIGRRLVQAVAERMWAQGCRHWRLNVRPGNEPAIKLYRSVGMEVVHASVALRFAWTLVDRLPPASRDLAVVPVADAEIPAIEEHFTLPRGQLAKLAAQPGVFLRRLADPERLCADLEGSEFALGVAAFDIGFPGCFPFRLADRGDLVTMLRGLQPLAVAPSMGVVVEDDDALAERMLAAGATVSLRFVHMVGELTEVAEAAG